MVSSVKLFQNDLLQLNKREIPSLKGFFIGKICNKDFSRYTVHAIYFFILYPYEYPLPFQ